MPDQELRPGLSLERQVADAYRAMGARKVEHDVQLAGNQIDVYVEMEAADRSLHRIAVEVKDWNKPVGIDVINEFSTIVDNLRNRARLVDEGVVVSASGFSRQARNAAETYGIRLLEPADLISVPIDEISLLEPTDLAAMATGPAVGAQAEWEQPTEVLQTDVTVQVFLSYAREDEGKVENLYQKLSDAGFKPWMDRRDILPGENWRFSIQQAIQSSDFFLVCLSDNSVNKRGFLQKEIKDALDIWQQMLDSDIYLIPVRLERCEVSPSLRKLQWVDLFKANGWTRLLKAIRVGMDRRGKVIKPIAPKKNKNGQKKKANRKERRGKVIKPIAQELTEAQAEQEQPTAALKMKQGKAEEIVRSDLEFANRESELEKLKAPIGNPGAPRYVQIHAPSGLGKTYLLRKASSEYEAAKWLCAWLDFSTDARLCHNPMRILEQLSGQFGGSGERVRTSADLAQQVMRARKNSVIFLDAVDLASGGIRRWIKMDLIPNLEDRIQDPKFRPYFIAAGRRPIREWAVYSKQRFESVQLTAFTDAVVDEFLRRFAREAGYDLEIDFFQSMAEAILSITKGHPACIKLVFHEIRNRDFTMTAQEVVQADTFNRTVGALLDDEILALQVSEKLREVFKMLCVLRGYTPSLLVRLAEDGRIPAREHVDWNLERELQATYLVEIPDGNPLYRIEPLIRQLVALQMAYNDEDKFIGLNQAALEIFEEQVRGRDKDGNELPNRPQDRMQVALAVEALYHQATLLEQEGAGARRAKNRLQGKVKEYLSHRSTRESENYWADLLVGLAEKDAELTALICKLTGEGGLQFVLQPLYEFAGTQEV